MKRLSTKSFSTCDCETALLQIKDSHYNRVFPLDVDANFVFKIVHLNVLHLKILRKCISLNLKSLNEFNLDVYKVDNIGNFVYYGKTRIE